MSGFLSCSPRRPHTAASCVRRLSEACRSKKPPPTALESPMGSSRSSQAEKTTRERVPAITNGCASCMLNARRQIQRSLSSKPEAPSLRTGEHITFAIKICKASRHGNQASSTAAAKSNGTYGIRSAWKSPARSFGIHRILSGAKPAEASSSATAASAAGYVDAVRRKRLNCFIKNHS